MADDIQAYSRLVRRFKIVLPILGLILLSSLFLLSKPRFSIDPNRALDSALARLISDSGVGRPSLRGTLPDGTSYLLTASKVLRKPEQVIAGERISLELTTGDERQMEVKAQRGAIQMTDRHARLEGGVRLAAVGDLEVVTSAVSIDVDNRTVRTDGHVILTSPSTTLDAGQMTIQPGTGPIGGYVIDFRNGVKLIYAPQN